jgi:hypothetical protein
MLAGIQDKHVEKGCDIIAIIRWREGTVLQNQGSYSNLILAKQHANINPIEEPFIIIACGC